MKNYNLLLQNKNKAGVPPVIQGVFTEHFDLKNPLPPMSGYSWTKPRDSNRVYPEELWLVTKDIYYAFDYIAFWDGYIISNEFREIVKKYSHPEYKEVKLNVVNWKGMGITEKQYYFIDIPQDNRVDIIDYKESNFALDEDMIKLRGQSIKDVKQDGPFFGNINNYSEIIFRVDSTNYDIFRLKDTVIHDLICSSNFFSEVEREIKTVKKIELSKMNEYTNRFH